MSREQSGHTYEAIVYTDASWCPTLKISVCGFLIIYCGGEFVFTDTFGDLVNNGIAEEQAVIKGLQRAFMLNGVKSIVVKTDYKNIVDAVKLNRTKSLLEETKDTIEMITDYGINLSFQWVKGHDTDIKNKKIDKACRKQLRELTTRVRM